MRSHNDLIFAVIEQYLYHQNVITDNPAVKETQEMMLDIDIDEMWMLTQ